MTTPARSALAVALGGMLLARAASGQPAVPPAAPPPPDTTAPEVQYDTYVEPFDDDPVRRLHYITPLPPPTPLFEDYDSLKGLDPYVQTSRVIQTSRAILSLAITSARVGQTVDIPLIHQSGPTPNALTLRVKFDPKVLKMVDAQIADWTNSSIVFNLAPEHKDPETNFVVVQYSAYASPPKAAMMKIRAQALAPGESAVEVIGFDMAADEAIPAIVRSGLVKVLP